MTFIIAYDIITLFGSMVCLFFWRGTMQEAEFAIVENAKKGFNGDYSFATRGEICQRYGLAPALGACDLARLASAKTDDLVFAASDALMHYIVDDITRHNDPEFRWGILDFESAGIWSEGLGRRLVITSTVDSVLAALNKEQSAKELFHGAKEIRVPIQMKFESQDFAGNSLESVSLCGTVRLSAPMRHENGDIDWCELSWMQWDFAEYPTDGEHDLEWFALLNWGDAMNDVDDLLHEVTLMLDAVDRGKPEA